MNEAIKYSVRQALDEVATNRHTVFTVKSILIDLRDCSPRGSIIRELGDFLAHPTQKDRGILHRNVSETFEGMMRFFRASRRLPIDGPPRFTVRPSFTDVEIVDDVLSLVSDRSIVDSADALLGQVRQQQASLSACILCLLQGARFKVGSHRLRAFIGMGPNDTLALNAIVPSEILTGDEFIDLVFPVITTQLSRAEWLTTPPPDADAFTTLYSANRQQGGNIKLSPLQTIREIGESQRGRS